MENPFAGSMEDAAEALELMAEEPKISSQLYQKEIRYGYLKTNPRINPALLAGLRYEIAALEHQQLIIQKFDEDLAQEQRLLGHES